ncbi:MAG: fumarylacetoacetase [Fimbriimonadaceae bacterium]
MAADSLFPIQNLPYAVFRRRAGDWRVGVRIGDLLLDLSAAVAKGHVSGPDVFASPSLNAFMALGRAEWTRVRGEIVALLSPGSAAEGDFSMLAPVNEVELQLPVVTRGFVDFYSSEQHASNVGRMFRDPEHPLLPNWKHLPVAYNGRASSLVGSGVPIRRPNGQTKRPDEPMPRFGPSRELDFELEMGVYIGKDSTLGEPVPIDRAADYLFGFALVNDWSARDVQRWEYQPLGPFLAKSFATSVGHYVVPVDALWPFRHQPPPQSPEVLPYLQGAESWIFDVALEVAIETPSGVATTVCRSNMRHLYWSAAQQLAHLTVNGANVEVGDLYATGTISGDAEGTYGSLLELSWKGERPVALADSSTRTFLLDGDTVRMSGWAGGPGYRVGFGALENTVLPSRS